MRKPANIALLGADDPLGDAVLRLISERDIEVGDIFPLTLSASDGCATVRGEELPLVEAAGFDWSHADIVINATRSLAAGRLEEAAAAAGCRVIGLGQDIGADGRIAVEGAVAAALQRTLAPIRRHAEPVWLNAVAMLPVAAAGEAGVAELVEQTRALFAMESPESEVFPLRIAFNLIPQVGAMLDDGSSRFEHDAMVETRALLACPDLPISVTALWAPLFYGGAITLHVGVAGTPDAAALAGWFADIPGITLMDAALPGGVATPATDAQDSDAIFVGRLRAGAGMISMWLVIDMMRLEASRLVDCMENLIEK